MPYANAGCDVDVWMFDRFDQHMDCPDGILLWLDIEGSNLSTLRSGPRLLVSGRIRWSNRGERRAGHCPASGWCDPQELHQFLTDHGYVRIADYNRHPTHQDVIYAHREEPCSALSR